MEPLAHQGDPQLPPPPGWRQRATRYLLNLQQGILIRWVQITNFQKCYLLAAVLLPLSSGLAATLAVIGLLLDFWPRFVRAWESLAGKAAILLFYAAVANFAFASAASVINDLTGVDADYLPYALHTALFLKLPTFVLAISALALMVFGLLLPLYLLGILALRLLGISHQKLFNHIRYPITTLLLRFVLSWLLIMQAADIFSGDEAPDDSTATTRQPALEAEAKTLLGIEAEDQDVVALDDSGYTNNIQRLLAQFIYHLEANEKSRCVLAPDERAVEMNDYQYLAVTRDKSAPHGFRYTVKPCQSPGITLPETSPSPAQ